MKKDDTITTSISPTQARRSPCGCGLPSAEQDHGPDGKGRDRRIGMDLDGGRGGEKRFEGHGAPLRFGARTLRIRHALDLPLPAVPFKGCFANRTPAFVIDTPLQSTKRELHLAFTQPRAWAAIVGVALS